MDAGVDQDDGAGSPVAEDGATAEPDAIAPWDAAVAADAADAAPGQCFPGAEQACGSSEGACEAGRQACTAAAIWGPCNGAVGPQPERCDSTDNDCDGRTDEGDPDGGGFCETGELGACGAGVRMCAFGELACVQQLEPAANDDECDGIDDDCDGNPDESWTPARSCGTGACARQERCVAGETVCAAGPPEGEACNGTDDDCDGRTDEDVSDEVCDGVDNDCDERVDEGDPGSGPCVTGEPGRCAAGTFHCLEGVRTCTRNAGPAATDEVCDAIDEDCDGRADESWTGGACGEGACQRPERCEDGHVRCAPGGPRAEACSGVDEDCDGQVDEGLAPTPSSCGVGVCRAEGEITCVDGVPADSCTPSEPGPENCDPGERDDDCDGRVDEGCLCENGSTRLCGSDVGRCVMGRQRCVGGQWAFCEADVPPAPEVCNGEDDDCNRTVDDPPALARELIVLPDGAGPDKRARGPSIAWTGEAFALVWMEERRDRFGEPSWALVFAQFDAGGGRLGPDVTLWTSPGATYTFPAIAWNGERLTVAWSGWNDEREHQVLVGSFLPGAEADMQIAQVATAHPLFVRLSWNGQEYGLVWDNQIGRPSPSPIRFARITADGERLSEPVQLSADGGADTFDPTLAWGINSWGVAWTIGGGAVRFRGVDAQGVPLAPMAFLNDAPRLGLPSLAWSGDAFLLFGGGGFIRLSPVGDQLGRPGAIPDAGVSFSALRWTGEHVVAVWAGTARPQRNGFFAARVRPDGGATSDAVQLAQGEVRPGQWPLSVVRAGDLFGAVWVDATEVQVILAIGTFGCPPADW